LLVAAHFGQLDRVALPLFSAPSLLDEHAIFLTLVWPKPVVVIQKYRTKVVQMPFAKHDEMIEAFLSKRLDKPLYESHRVGRTIGGSPDPQAGLLQSCIEAGGKLRIPVVHHDIGAQSGFFSVHDKRLGLVTDPGLVRVVRGRSHKRPPSLNVEKHEYEQIAKAFRRHSFERQKVALPKRGATKINASTRSENTAA
jgi:hypothetical protein